MRTLLLGFALSFSLPLAAQTPQLAPAVKAFVSVDAPVFALTHVKVIDGTGAPATVCGLSVPAPRPEPAPWPTVGKRADQSDSISMGVGPDAARDKRNRRVLVVVH